MTHTATKFDFMELPTDFAGLMARHTVCEIHDEVGHSNAMEMIDALAGYSLSPGQSAYLAALSQLVEAYEKEAYQGVCEKQTPTEMLKYLVEENNMSGSDLGRLLGTARVATYPDEPRFATSYRVVLDIAEFERVTDGSVSLRARFTIAATKDGKALVVEDIAVQQPVALGGGDRFRRTAARAARDTAMRAAEEERTAKLLHYQQALLENLALRSHIYKI
jgi:antitoxin component HigA of HigAB toxin-antitoxin module